MHDAKLIKNSTVVSLRSAPNVASWFCLAARQPICQFCLPMFRGEKRGVTKRREFARAGEREKERKYFLVSVPSLDFFALSTTVFVDDPSRGAKLAQEPGEGVSELLHLGLAGCRPGLYRQHTGGLLYVMFQCPLAQPAPFSHDHRDVWVC